ncbi:MAG: hypothetical protein AAF438_11075, partial [Pseudomonadota bacterium]
SVLHVSFCAFWAAAPGVHTNVQGQLAPAVPSGEAPLARDKAVVRTCGLEAVGYPIGGQQTRNLSQGKQGSRSIERGQVWCMPTSVFSEGWPHT